MQMRLDETLVRFSGILNEDSDFENIKARLEPFQKSKVRVSFAEVLRANSCGITAWFRVVRDLDLAVSYIEAPVWLVEQFNISPFFLRRALVESFYAPFFDPATNHQTLQLVSVAPDLKLRTERGDDPFEKGVALVYGLEPDFEPSEYLQFLTAMASSDQGQGTT